MRDEATEQSLAADIAAIYQEAEAERLAGIRDRVYTGIKGMADEFARSGINPIIGISVGSLMGVLHTMIDHASEQQVDDMLQKMIALMYGWRMPEEPPPS